MIYWAQPVATNNYADFISGLDTILVGIATGNILIMSKSILFTKILKFGFFICIFIPTFNMLFWEWIGATSWKTFSHTQNRQYMGMLEFTLMIRLTQNLCENIYQYVFVMVLRTWKSCRWWVAGLAGPCKEIYVHLGTSASPTCSKRCQSSNS